MIDLRETGSVVSKSPVWRAIAMQAANDDHSI